MNARRHSSQDYQEDRSQAMYPMPGTPTENEQFSRPSYSNTTETQGRILTWLVIIAYGVFILRTVWRDPDFQLSSMHLVVKASQGLARKFGEIALQTEHEYNEYCKLLH